MSTLPFNYQNEVFKELQAMSDAGVIGELTEVHNDAAKVIADAEQTAASVSDCADLLLSGGYLRFAA